MTKQEISDNEKYLDPVFLAMGEEVYTYEFAEKIRNENLRAKKRGGDTRIYDLIPQAGFQEHVLTSEADIMLIGGKRGGGKSFVAMMMMLRYAFMANARMYAFRKYKEDVENTIWEASSRVFTGFGTPTKSNFTWTFPSGATVTMTHIADAKEVKNRFRGAEAACIDIEELPEHTTENLNVLRELSAACRSTLGIKPKLIATFNPIDPSHPLYQLISWWINPDTDEFIHERSGTIRYLFFYGKDADEFVMGGSKEEVYEDPRVRFAIDKVTEVTGQGYESLITSFTVIEGDFSDNKILQTVDPTYLSKLAVAGTAALLRDTAGLYRRVEEGDSQLSTADMEKFFNAAERRDGIMRASCDVAISGDFLVIFAFDGHHICDMEVRRGGMSDDIIPFIEGFLERNSVRKENFTYDSNGLGLWLKESQAFKNKAVEFNNKSAASDPRLWNNLKSECAEKFIRAIKAEEFSIDSELLKRTMKDKRGRIYTVRERLLEERRALKRKDDAQRFEIIEKKQMKHLIGHSPDIIEALFMVMHLYDRGRRTNKTRTGNWGFFLN